MAQSVGLHSLTYSNTRVKAGTNKTKECPIILYVNIFSLPSPAITLYSILYATTDHYLKTPSDGLKEEGQLKWPVCLG